MKQKVAIARTLVHDPILLFLDQPTANLDPEAAKMVRDVILELKKEKRTIFLNTHHLDEAQRICDRVGILRTRLLTTGSVEALRSGSPGSRTVVRLERGSEQLARAVRARLGARSVEISGDQLTVEVEDPDRENPEIAEAVIAAGGRIRQLTQLSPSLEDVYLQARPRRLGSGRVMRLSQAWIVARHDMGIIRRKRGIALGLVALPLGVGIGFPLLVDYIILQAGDMSVTSYLPTLIDAFTFWFVIGAAILPNAIAAYGIIGEKIEKSLEPLLSTPTTDGELLLGKVLASFLPTMLAVWAGIRSVSGTHRLVQPRRVGVPLLPELGDGRHPVPPCSARVPLRDRAVGHRLVAGHGYSERPAVCRITFVPLIFVYSPERSVR